MSKDYYFLCRLLTGYPTQRSLEQLPSALSLKVSTKGRVWRMDSNHRQLRASSRFAWLGNVDCVWNVMAHAQKPDFVLLRLKCDGTCAETRVRLTAFEMWWHMRRNQISSYCVWNVMAHAQKPDCVLLRLKCDSTRAETRIRLSAKRTSPFKSAGGR